MQAQNGKPELVVPLEDQQNGVAFFDTVSLNEVCRLGRICLLYPSYTRCNVLGACICILSVIPLFSGAFLTENDLFMVCMLSVTMILAGIGVVFFITAGIHWASMEKLLQEGDYSRQKKKKSNLTGALSTVYWLIVVAGYLAVSFTAEDWNNSWIIWPCLLYTSRPLRRPLQHLWRA